MIMRSRVNDNKIQKRDTISRLLRHALPLLLLTLVAGRAWGQGITSLDDITDPNGTYTLASNFSTTGTPANDIGSSSNPFKGTIDGGLVTITGTWNKPLFDYVEDAVIKNVIIGNASVSGSACVGAIAGTASGATRIYNCGILDGSVRSTGAYTDNPKTDNACGGLVGLLDGTARVINCYSYATITGGNRVGGIVGYNNGTTNSGSITTMVMNCMFYGDITGGNKVSPVYGGNKIDNLQNNSGLNTFNYYAYDKLKTASISGDSFYNCALAVEERFLTRFEFYRQMLNSNKKLAAWYATGSVANAAQMAKWVLETADRTIANPKPYPILKAQGYYPSIINPDLDINNVPDSATVGRNKGGKLPSPRQTLYVTIRTKSQKTTGGQSWPTAAASDVQTTSLTLVRTDMDEDRFNFNYDKVQLPYYNDIGTGNYTEGRVVTGWKITSFTGGTAGTYTASDTWNGYNFADRNCTNKDKYSVSGRVFSQGAYYDVPYGVTAIEIEPYWGYAAFVADERFDYVFTNAYGSKTGISAMGKQVDNWTFNEVSVKTNMKDALATISTKGSTVYDNAIVLVGNFHQTLINAEPFTKTTPFSIMSVDLDNDHEPDYSMIFHDNARTRVNPIRFDFLNIPGTAQAQKPNGADNILNASVFKPSSWFEITNTCLIYFSQFEYENSSKTAPAPVILLGGVFDQFTSTKDQEVKNTTYLHVGSNAWFKEFNNGTHSDGSKKTKHIPISVTGGDYDAFYLTGTFKPDAAIYSDNAECYVSGGHFIELAGAGQEQIDGNVQWQIYNADIDNFYGGGINDAKPIKGTITTEIYNSHVNLFCGGPKFGNMQSNKAVSTTAQGCIFGEFFGAGFGGNSIGTKKYYDKSGAPTWSTLEGYYTGDRGKYYDGETTQSSQVGGGTNYGFKGPGVAVDFKYEYFVWTSGTTGARLYVKFAAFSLAQCNNVTSSLTNCTINRNFYGGGSLGKVLGDVTSTLTDCTVHGSVFGAGFSATLPTLEVRNAGFVTNKTPNYNKYSGMFEPGVYSGTTTFTWKNAEEAGETLTNGNSGSDLETNHYIYTDQDLTSLGTVTGKVTLTLGGTTTVTGDVFGGGEESAVNGNVTVTLQDRATINGNVFGGGNQGDVTGSTEVNIKQ